MLVSDFYRACTKLYHSLARIADVEYCGAQLETIGDMQAIYICVSRRERRYIKTDSLLFVALRTIRAQFDIARFLSSLTMNKRYEARTTSVCDHYLRRAHIIEHQRCILRCSFYSLCCSPLYSLINMQHRMRQVAECQATIFLRFSNYVSSLLFSAAHGSTLQM